MHEFEQYKILLQENQKRSALFNLKEIGNNRTENSDISSLFRLDHLNKEESEKIIKEKQKYNI